MVIGKSSVVSATRRRLDLAHGLVWLFRVLWALLPVTAGPLFETCVAHASRPMQVVTALGLWTAWTIVLAASLIPTMITLTLVRMIAPGAVLAAVVASTRDVSGAAAVAGLTTTAFAALVAFTAEVGEVFVQAAAYGDERRFPLRVPGPIAVTVLPMGWLVAASSAITGPLLLAAGRWIVGAIVTVLAVVWGVLFARRSHRLSRRFAVFVPAGFVLHDHVVLADTAMFAAATVRGLHLAPAGSEAADATGAALGVAVELQLTEPGTIVLAGTIDARQGKALHVHSVLFSPSRPGRLLAAAAARRWRLP